MRFVCLPFFPGKLDTLENWDARVRVKQVMCKIQWKHKKRYEARAFAYQIVVNFFCVCEISEWMSVTRNFLLIFHAKAHMASFSWRFSSSYQEFRLFRLVFIDLNLLLIDLSFEWVLIKILLIPSHPHRFENSIGEWVERHLIDSINSIPTAIDETIPNSIQYLMRSAILLCMIQLLTYTRSFAWINNP